VLCASSQCCCCCPPAFRRRTLSAPYPPAGTGG
jgi:hypothetical protein